MDEGEVNVREPKWTYMLRIPRHSLDAIRMDRLAMYMREFAQLLGVENFPVFAGIKKASVGLTAKVPSARRPLVWKRIQDAKQAPRGSAGRHLAAIEHLVTEDDFRGVELRDNADKVLYLFQPKSQPEVIAVSVKQQGVVDGIVTGLVGADDTMHLYLRDCLSRDLRLVVRDEVMARNLLQHFRKGPLRVRVHGPWARTDCGWVPESSKCLVDGFEVLDGMPLSEVMAKFAAVPGNGWCDLPDADAEWRDLRGISHG